MLKEDSSLEIVVLRLRQREDQAHSPGREDKELVHRCVHAPRNRGEMAHALIVNHGPRPGGMHRALSLLSA